MYSFLSIGQKTSLDYLPQNGSYNTKSTKSILNFNWVKCIPIIHRWPIYEKLQKHRTGLNETTGYTFENRPLQLLTISSQNLANLDS
jgi:hypothetical protein